MREFIAGLVIEQAHGKYDPTETNYGALSLVYQSGTLYRGQQDLKEKIPAGSDLADTQYWEVIYVGGGGGGTPGGGEGNTFTVWDITKTYSAIDMVLVDGIHIYEAIADVPSGIPIDDIRYWKKVSTVAESNDTIIVWRQTRTYREGNHASDGGIIYKAIRDVPVGIDIIDTTYWELVYNPHEEQLLIWDNTRNFWPKSKVLVNNTDIYEAVVYVPIGTAITNTAYWKLLYRPSDGLVLTWSLDQSFFKGALVLHEGVEYKALKNVPVGTPLTNATYWEVQRNNTINDTLMVWDNTRPYVAGNRVLIGQNVYRAKVTVPIGAYIEDAQYWELEYTLGSAVVAWDNTGTHNKGDQVMVNGIMYEAVSNVPPGILITDTQFWKQIGTGSDAVLKWSSDRPYGSGVSVLHEGDVYTSSQAVPTGTAITDTTYWDLVYRANADAIKIWRLTNSYTKDDQVIDNGAVYKAKSNVPTNTQITNQTYWELMYSPGETILVWNKALTFEKGVHAMVDGAVYKAKLKVPANTEITNTTYWEFVENTKGTVEWESSTTYHEGASVSQRGNIYKAKKYVPAGTLVTNTEYWELKYTNESGMQVWNSSREWGSGVTVTNNGSVYQAIKDVPVGVAITDTEYWDVIYSAQSKLVVHNTTLPYKKDDQVISNGSVYLALQDVPVGTQLTATIYWSKIHQFIGGGPVAHDSTKSYDEAIQVFVGNAIYISKKPVPTGIAITNGEYWEKIIFQDFTQIDNITNELEEYKSRTRATEDAVQQAAVRQVDLENLLADEDRTNQTMRNAYQIFLQEQASGRNNLGFVYANRRIETINTAVTTQAEEIAQLTVAVDENLATSLEYTRTAVGYCVDAQGATTTHQDAVLCVTAGHTWVNGPLAESIRNLQVTNGTGNQVSISNIAQTYETVNGKLVARGGITTDVNGRVSGFITQNDGTQSSFDILAEKFRVGDFNNNTYTPLIELDATSRVLKVRGQLILGDGYTVATEDDIRAFDGQPGPAGDTIYREFQFSPDGSTDWSTSQRATDNFMRSRLVTNGINGTWESPVKITGVDGTSIVEKTIYKATAFGWSRVLDHTPSHLLDSDPSNQTVVFNTNSGYVEVTTHNDDIPNLGTGVRFEVPVEDVTQLVGSRIRIAVRARSDVDGTSFNVTYWTNGQGNSNNQGENYAFATTDWEWHTIEYNNVPVGADGNPDWVSILPEIGGTIQVSHMTVMKVEPTPTGGSYNFETNTLTPPIGWSEEYPIDSDAIIASTGSFTITGGTGIANTDWSVPALIYRSGFDGVSAKERYTWIKYADDEDGNGLSDSPVSKRYMGVAYNKETATESTAPADYTWSLIRGADGNDGNTVFTEFSFSPDGSTDWSNIQRSTDQFLRSRIVTNGVSGSWSSVTRIRGFDGTDATERYTWIKYADDDVGTGISNSPIGKTYIGVAYNKTSATESNTPADYTWSLIKGSDGADATTFFEASIYKGVPYYVEKRLNKNSAFDLIGSEVATPVYFDEYVAVTATAIPSSDTPGKTTGASFQIDQATTDLYVGKTIRVMAKMRMGTTNQAIAAFITDQKGNSNARNFTLSPIWEWYEFDYSVSASLSTSPDHIGFWSGEVGKSIHVSEVVMFEVPSDPTGGAYNFDTKVLTPPAEWSITIPTTSDVIWTTAGIFSTAGSSGIDNTVSWVAKGIMSRAAIAGTVGSDGVDGNDATERYTWIKYADDENGAGLSDVPTGKKYIGIAYNKVTQTESTVATDYTWSLIKGTDGQDGSTIYKEFNFSPTGTSDWSATQRSTDKYMRSRTVTNGTPGTWSAATRIVGLDGVDGNDGTDATERYTWIKYADDSVGNGLSDNPNGKDYIGIAYNKTSAVESTNPADYDWALVKGDSAFTNMIRPDRDWVIGTDGSQGPFTQFGTDGENHIIEREGPRGTREKVWYANFGNNGQDGGWQHFVTVDESQNYRYVCWAMQIGGTNQTLGFRWSFDTTETLAGAADSSPYIFEGDLPVLDKWYCIVGVLHRSGNSGQSDTNISGVYDPSTGEKVLDGVEYRMKVGTTRQQHSVFRHGVTTSSHTALFARPRFEVMDGTEMGLSDILGRVPVDGADGADGAKGDAGAGFYTLTLRDGVFPADATATSDFTTAYGRAPVKDDHLTYRNASGTVSATKRYNGSGWVAPSMIIHGDLISTGTITGDRLVAGVDIKGPQISGGVVHADQYIAQPGNSAYRIMSTYNQEVYGTMDPIEIINGGNEPYLGDSTFPDINTWVVDNNTLYLNFRRQYQQGLDEMPQTIKTEVRSFISTALPEGDYVHNHICTPHIKPYDWPNGGEDKYLRCVHSGSAANPDKQEYYVGIRLNADHVTPHTNSYEYNEDFQMNVSRWRLYVEVTSGIGAAKQVIYAQRVYAGWNEYTPIMQSIDTPSVRLTRFYENWMPGVYQAKASNAGLRFQVVIPLSYYSQQLEVNLYAYRPDRPQDAYRNILRSEVETWMVTKSNV